MGGVGSLADVDPRVPDGTTDRRAATGGDGRGGN